MTDKKGVLFVGPYRQWDEWGKCSRAFVKNIAEHPNSKLSIRPVWFNSAKEIIEIEGVLKNCEFSRPENLDVLIQYGLPNMLNYNGRFKKNVAVTSVDCRIDNTDWVMHLNMFDQVVVFSKYEQELLEQSGVTSKILSFKISPPLGMRIGINEKFDIPQRIKFYTNGSMDQKGGMTQTIISYLSSGLTNRDDVILIIATEDEKSVNQSVDMIRKGLGIFKNESYYPTIGISSLEKIDGLHKSCDFYIDSSYNARVGQTTLNAMQENSIVIVPDCLRDVFDYEYPFLINTDLEKCVYPQKPIAGLYSGEFSWRVPNTQSLSEKILMAYSMKEEEKEDIINKNSKCIAEGKKEIREKIGEILCI